MEQHDRFLFAVSLEPRVKIRVRPAKLGGIEDRCGYSFAVQDAFQKTRGKNLVAGRIGCIDPEIICKDRLAFLCKRIPIDWLLRRCRKRQQGASGQNSNEAFFMP
jgi:hypothetical protein